CEILNGSRMTPRTDLPPAPADHRIPGDGDTTGRFNWPDGSLAPSTAEPTLRLFSLPAPPIQMDHPCPSAACRLASSPRYSDLSVNIGIEFSPGQRRQRRNRFRWLR